MPFSLFISIVSYERRWIGDKNLAEVFYKGNFLKKVSLKPSKIFYFLQQCCKMAEIQDLCSAFKSI